MPKVINRKILIFTDNENWRTAVSAINVDDIAPESGKYSVAAGTVVIDKSVFTTAKNYVITIGATGYSNAGGTQNWPVLMCKPAM